MTFEDEEFWDEPEEEESYTAVDLDGEDNEELFDEFGEEGHYQSEDDEI